jgi:hypothetical protein
MSGSRNVWSGKSLIPKWLIPRWLVCSVAVAAMAIPLVAGLLPAVAATAAPKPLVPEAEKPVPVHTVHGKRVKVPVMREWRPSPVSWPSAGGAGAAPPT